jgi:hypothetical protein
MTGTPLGFDLPVCKSAEYYIYPNPASDLLHIGGPADKKVNCTVYAADGRVVLNRNTAVNSNINIAALPAGTYVYVVTDETGKVVDKNRLTVSR